jgi:hypothetical protein
VHNATHVALEEGWGDLGIYAMHNAPHVLRKGGCVTFCMHHPYQPVLLFFRFPASRPGYSPHRNPVRLG